MAILLEVTSQHGSSSRSKLGLLMQYAEKITLVPHHAAMAFGHYMCKLHQL
jgi:hypothetical protein